MRLCLVFNPSVLCEHRLPMVGDQSTHEWLGQFAVRLMRLRQDISRPCAVPRAVVAHGHSSDLMPEEAAKIDAAVSALKLPLKVPCYSNPVRAHLPQSDSLIRATRTR